MDAGGADCCPNELILSFTGTGCFTKARLYRTALLSIHFDLAADQVIVHDVPCPDGFAAVKRKDILEAALDHIEIVVRGIAAGVRRGHHVFHMQKRAVQPRRFMGKSIDARAADGMILKGLEDCSVLDSKLQEAYYYYDPACYSMQKLQETMIG